MEPDESQEIEAMLQTQQPVHSDEPIKIEFDMKPRDVKESLDKDVIKQDMAKKMLANAVCYHYARIKRDQENGNGADTAIKKNVLMIGNTGVGKTYLVSKISKLIGVPFVKADATKFSATGYVGKDVEETVRNLYFVADKNIQLAQYGIIYVDEIDKIRSGITFGKDVSGVEVQRGLLKLMEETDVDVMSNSDPLAAMQAMQEMQRTGKKPTLNTKHILFIMAGAFPGLHDIVAGRVPNANGNWKDFLTAQDFIEYGMEPEFVGRLPIRVALDDLEEDDLYHILKRSGDSVIKQYMRDFDAYGIKVTFADEALRAFAALGAQETTGARALTGIIENILIDFMYELPSTDIKELDINQKLIEHPRETLVKMVMEPTVRRFSQRFYDEYGVKITFEKEAYKLIEQRALDGHESPDEICYDIMRGYVDALKVYGQKEFTISADVVKDPEGYLKRLLKDHDKQ